MSLQVFALFALFAFALPIVKRGFLKLFISLNLKDEKGNFMESYAQMQTLFKKNGLLDIFLRNSHGPPDSFIPSSGELPMHSRFFYEYAESLFLRKLWQVTR